VRRRERAGSPSNAMSIRRVRISIYVLACRFAHDDASRSGSRAPRGHSIWAVPGCEVAKLHRPFRG
jgi:hypothetical protein